MLRSRTILFCFFLLCGRFICAQDLRPKFTFDDGFLDYGSVMIRHDILFDLSKATLRPEDSIPLDSMAAWMKLHPEFMVEVSNHTDYVNPKSSTRLTQARADAIRNYLVNRGVPAYKITAVGYGDSRNIIPNAFIAKEASKQKQDSMRAINRRTEFRIIAVYAYLEHPFLLTDTIFWPGEVLRDEGKILFDLDKSALRPESKLYLDTIVMFMKAHPQMKIEVDAHTDSRGNDNHNLDLSQRRAQCVADYLISQGIDPSRLRSKGFGETQPIWRDIEVHFKTPEEKEAKYEVNRRIEFKIISVK